MRKVRSARVNASGAITGYPGTTEEFDKEYPATHYLKADVGLYLERRQAYGPSEQDFGQVMTALFPDGLVLKTKQDWVRYGLLHQMVGKLVRYCNNFPEQGHADSLQDLRVYSGMLQAEDNSLTERANVLLRHPV